METNCRGSLLAKEVFSHKCCQNLVVMALQRNVNKVDEAKRGRLSNSVFLIICKRNWKFFQFAVFLWHKMLFPDDKFSFATDY